MRESDETDDHAVQSRREWLRERAPDPRPDTRLRDKLPSRPFTAPRTRLAALLFTVGVCGAAGAALSLAGFCLLVLSVLNGATLGVFLSSFALTGGATTALMSYIWFTE